MTASRVLPAILISALAIGACGSDDDGSTDAPDDTATAPADEATTDPESEPADVDAAEPDEAVPPGGGGQGNAVLTLANGETYEFSVLCTLEPQIAAGSEILFTATSYDNPSLDITQFGDEGTVTEIASVSVNDAETFDSLWGASSIYEPFGGSLELTLDGSTIRGVGSFFAGDDPGASPEAVDGEVVANC